MSNLSIQQDAPVVITPEEIAQSNRNRAKRPRLVTQTPAYRAASNISYFAAEILMKSPNGMRKIAENLDLLCNDLLRDIAYAYDCREGRYEALSDAIALATVISTKLNIFNKKGIMSNDAYNKTKQISRSLVAQLAAWRSSSHGQCAVV